MATAPSPNDLTRQQLDELDALLQRMLSVPLTPAETPMPAATPAPRSTSEGPPLPPVWRVDPPTAAGVSSPHIVLPESPPAPVPPPAPPAPIPAPAPKPAAAAPAPKPPTPPLAPKAVPPVPPPTPKPAPAASARAATSSPAPTAESAAAAPVPLPLLPLVAFNALFDSICGLFGPVGRLLRSGICKQIYGLVGLALLIYTAAHIAKEQGWLTLPISLPWPR